MPDTPENVFARADSAVVREGYARLGPIANITDVLDQSAGVDQPVVFAAEQIGHLLDAFRYFSSALTAHLGNSNGNAVHFGYYCELRAALSLFAGSGVRVKLGENCLITAAGAIEPFDTGDRRTHPLAWKLWSAWIKTAQASDLLLDGVKLMQGLSLRDFSALPNVSAIVLDSWGYDFFEISNADHIARNNASYNAFPSDPLHIMGADAPDLVVKIWSLLMSQGGGIAFDAALMRYFIEQLAQGQSNPEDYKRLLYESASNHTGVPADTIESLVGQAGTSTLFDFAAAQQSEPRNVLSRAFFLLRVAVLSVQANARHSGRKDVVDAWLSNWLSSLGLFNPQDVDIGDVEEDYLNALEKFSAISGDLPAAMWSTDQAFSTSRLTRTEAFVAWGLVAY